MSLSNKNGFPEHLSVKMWLSLVGNPAQHLTRRASVELNLELAPGPNHFVKRTATCAQVRVAL